jgi:hypothetical protein
MNQLVDDLTGTNGNQQHHYQDQHMSPFSVTQGITQTTSSHSHTEVPTFTSLQTTKTSITGSTIMQTRTRGTASKGGESDEEEDEHVVDFTPPPYIEGSATITEEEECGYLQGIAPPDFKK